MATSKLNKEQYANIGSFAGIMLVYNSTNKDGELVQTAQHFFGADFEPADKSDNEIFRVIKNMVATMWHTIAEEKKLRADADGIRSKFRATTPAEIIICDKSNNRIKRLRPDRQCVGPYRTGADQSRPRKVEPRLCQDYPCGGKGNP